jgi:hypothetical protein
LHIRPELGRLKLRDLRPEHIYATLQTVAEGRSAAMVHRVRATLRTALAAAVKERLLLGVGEAAAEQRAGMIPRVASRADGHSSATNGA